VLRISNTSPSQSSVGVSTPKVAQRTDSHTSKRDLTEQAMNIRPALKHLAQSCLKESGPGGVYVENLVRALDECQPGLGNKTPVYAVLKRLGKLPEFRATIKEQFMDNPLLWWGPGHIIAAGEEGFLALKSKMKGLDSLLDKLEKTALESKSKLGPIARKLLDQSKSLRSDIEMRDMVEAIAEFGIPAHSDHVQGPGLIALALKEGIINEPTARNLLKTATNAVKDSEGNCLMPGDPEYVALTSNNLSAMEKRSLLLHSPKVYPSSQFPTNIAA
jgi:hypothetical protein